jgi:hypothetical protein
MGEEGLREGGRGCGGGFYFLSVGQIMPIGTEKVMLIVRGRRGIVRVGDVWAGAIRGVTNTSRTWAQETGSFTYDECPNPAGRSRVNVYLFIYLLKNAPDGEKNVGSSAPSDPDPSPVVIGFTLRGGWLHRITARRAVGQAPCVEAGPVPPSPSHPAAGAVPGTSFEAASQGVRYRKGDVVSIAPCWLHRLLCVFTNVASHPSGA